MVSSVSKNVQRNARTKVYVDYIPQDPRGGPDGYHCVRRLSDNLIFYGYQSDIDGKAHWDRLRFTTHVSAPIYATNKGAIIAAHNFGFKVVKKPMSRR